MTETREHFAAEQKITCSKLTLVASNSLSKYALMGFLLFFASCSFRGWVGMQVL
jgi:hypothetical protein